MSAPASGKPEMLSQGELVVEHAQTDTEVEMSRKRRPRRLSRSRIGRGSKCLPPGCHCRTIQCRVLLQQLCELGSESACRARLDNGPVPSWFSEE